MRTSTELTREAYRAAGEKRFPLARLVYAVILGGHWRHALLGFAYMKCVDNLVDEDSDADRALDTLATQRRFIDDVYAGRAAPPGALVPQRFGFPFFCFDRDRGAPLRPTFETILDTMETDTRRRGVVLSAADLDAHMAEVGTCAFRFILHFAAPELALPEAFLERASRAYLSADTLIDLEHDLRFGVINIPAEDLADGELHLSVADPALRRWIESRASWALADFSAAARQAKSVERWRVRLLARIFLTTKRNHLLRYLEREGLQPRAAEPDAAEARARRPLQRDAAFSR